MGDYFFKVGTTLYDAFDYSVSGLSTGSFTIQVDKNGAVGSTTGITIAQVGSTQAYIVTVSGTTGFVNAAGTYHLTIAHTAQPLNRWETNVRVTTDGLPTGSTGTANFTASSGQGRITDGTNPLSGVSVRFTRPSGGGFYTSVTTTAGLWGPVYFDADGVWPFTAQIAGYSAGSGVVTVTAGVATGPVTDIALTAMSSSGITLSQLTAYARRMYRDRTGSKAEAELTQIVNDALMMLSTEHEWPWFQTVGRVNIRAAYSVGSIAITNGSTAVVLTGGTFPFATVGVDGPAEIYINGMYHRLASITDGTNAVLVNTWQEANYSGSYTLAQIEYTLPSDLMRLSKITATNEWVWGPDPISRFSLEEARQRYSLGASAPPRMWAIERDRIVIWPAPGTDRMCNILYIRRPAELVSPGDTADWDFNLQELLRRAIDYQVACRGDCVAGDKAETFRVYRESISRNISQDRTATTWRPGLVSNGYDDLRIPGVTILG